MPARMRGHRIPAVAATLFMGLATALSAGPDDPPPPIPVFNVGDFSDSSHEIENPYWPLPVGMTWVYEGETEDGPERIVVTALEETRWVMGVECRVVLDRAFVDGERVEETFDWYAQDHDSNVWYFGEETYEYEDGDIVSTDGAWEAGVDGALPGIVMPAIPQVGESYRQEYYAGEAEDMAEVIALDAIVTLGDGMIYSNVLQTLEWTPLDPEALEHKYYVRGEGMVREELEDGSEPIDLVNLGVTLKTGRLIVEHNATDEDTGFQGFIDSEGWQRLEVGSPEGEPVLAFQAHGGLGDLGMTELFFETVEPENAEVPFEEMLAKMTAGFYLVEGPTMEVGESEGDTIGTPELTHDVPEGPELLSPSEDASVEAGEALEMSWAPVSEDVDGEPVEIVAYQLIVQQDEAPHPHMIGKQGFSAYLAPSATRVTLPAGFLEDDADYEWEVLAIEESGNQTLSSSAFTTTGEGEEVVSEGTPAAEFLGLKEAKLIIEHNATDEDTGFQGFIDSEGWQRLEVVDPDAMPVLTFEGLGELGQLGLTELFFETVEPENVEVSIPDMLARMPAGDYTVFGPSMENGEQDGYLFGTAWLSHTIPSGPTLLNPGEDALAYAHRLEARWGAVTKDIHGGPVNIIAYQLIIEPEEEPPEGMIGKFGLNVYLPATTTSFQVPRGILEPGRAYSWEVLAIEESGNQTLSSSSFETREPFVLDIDEAALSWASTPGRGYRVERRESMVTGSDWTKVGDVEATGPRTTYELGSILTAQSQAFFRVTDVSP